jgi:hypothetical protein
MVTSSSSHTFSVEKCIPPIMSEIAEIGQKTEGILGVKVGFPFPNKQHTRSYILLIRVKYKE